MILYSYQGTPLKIDEIPAGTVALVMGADAVVEVGKIGAGGGLEMRGAGGTIKLGTVGDNATIRFGHDTGKRVTAKVFGKNIVVDLNGNGHKLQIENAGADCHFNAGRGTDHQVTVENGHSSTTGVARGTNSSVVVKGLGVKDKVIADPRITRELEQKGRLAVRPPIPPADARTASRAPSAPGTGAVGKPIAPGLAAVLAGLTGPPETAGQTGRKGMPT